MQLGIYCEATAAARRPPKAGDVADARRGISSESRPLHRPARRTGTTTQARSGPEQGRAGSRRHLRCGHIESGLARGAGGSARHPAKSPGASRRPESASATWTSGWDRDARTGFTIQRKRKREKGKGISGLLESCHAVAYRGGLLAAGSVVFRRRRDNGLDRPTAACRDDGRVRTSALAGCRGDRAPRIGPCTPEADRGRSPVASPRNVRGS